VSRGEFDTAGRPDWSRGRGYDVTLVTGFGSPKPHDPELCMEKNKTSQPGQTKSPIRRDLLTSCARGLDTNVLTAAVLQSCTRCQCRSSSTCERKG
jgi:hypothetical protein